MPTAIPIPSKGALRALRNLALGTSGTVAAGAGLLTEERRRRIHAARQVFENAQTLKSFKSARGYHGAVAIESFEEQVVHHGEDTFWLPSNVARFENGKGLEHWESQKSKGPEHVNGTNEQRQEVEGDVDIVMGTPTLPERPTPLKIRSPTHAPQRKLKKISVPVVSVSRSRQNRGEIGLAQSATISPIVQTVVVGEDKLQEATHASQIELALNLESALDGHDGSARLELALKLFSDYFSLHGPTVAPSPVQARSMIHLQLLNCTARLFKAAGRCERFTDQDRILVVMSRYAQDVPIIGWDDVFSAEVLSKSMERIMKKARVHPRSKEDSGIGRESLLDIVSLFLMQTNTATETCSHEEAMFKIGESLCKELFEAELYETIRVIFHRLKHRWGHSPVNAAQYLIQAEFASGNYDLCFEHYKHFHAQIAWHQTSFYNVGTCVLDSLLHEDRFKDANQFLQLAYETARTRNLKLSSTWLLKTLGSVHRRSKEFARTRELFEDLTPLLSRTGHPQTLYSAIIQFCIESDHETLVVDYHRRLIACYPEHANDIHILGHLVLAKAKQGDWTAVCSSLQELHRQHPKRTAYQHEKFNAIFTPIMKLFASSHDIPTSENFLQTMIESCDLQITPHLFNLMVSVYAKGNETDSLLRWIQFAFSNKCNIGPVTINTLLFRFANSYNFTFHEIKLLYLRFQEIGQHHNITLVNSKTDVLLEKLAIQMGRSREERQENLAKISHLRTQRGTSDFHFSKTDKLERSMMKFYENGHYTECLDLYTCTIREKSKPTPTMLRIAVKAQLEDGGDYSRDARNLIRHAHKEGVDVANAIGVFMVNWIQKLEEKHYDAIFIAENMQEEIKSMMGSGVKPSLNVFTRTVHMLVKHNKYQAAIDFWQAMSKYFNQSPANVDLLTLTSLTYSYHRLQNSRGIRWSVGMLTRNNLFPDARFYQVLTRARVDVRKNKSRYLPEYCQCIEDVCLEVRLIRRSLFQRNSEVLSDTVKVMRQVTGRHLGKVIVPKTEVVQFQVQDRQGEFEFSRDSSVQEDEPTRWLEAAVG